MHARKCKPSGPSFNRSFITCKFSMVKIQRQNHKRFHKSCVNIAIIHYIFSNLIIYYSNFDYILIILFLYKKCHL